MFKRVHLESWHEVVPYLCFALIAGAFILIVVQVVRMKKSDVSRISRLPLLDDEDIKAEVASTEEPRS